MKKEIFGGMDTLASGMNKENKTNTSSGIFDENELKRNANELGEGVTYVSGEKITTDEYIGYKAIYKFTDISKLTINQSPGGSVKSEQQKGGKESKKELITFQFKKTDQSELLVIMPEKKIDVKTETTTSVGSQTPVTNTEPNEMMMNMMKMMLDGMKVAINIDIQGTITYTDADHHQGRRVTLMNIDFNELLKDKDRLNKLNSLQPDTLEDTKEIMKDIPGMKVDLKNKIIIKFKK